MHTKHRNHAQTLPTILYPSQLSQAISRFISYPHDQLNSYLMVQSLQYSHQQNNAYTKYKEKRNISSTINYAYNTLQSLLYQYNTQSKVHVQTETTTRHHATTKSEPRCALGVAQQFQTTAQRCTRGSCAEPHFLHLRKFLSTKCATHSCNFTTTKKQPIMLPTSICPQLAPSKHVHTSFLCNIWIPNIMLMKETKIKWLRGNIQSW